MYHVSYMQTRRKYLLHSVMPLTILMMLSLAKSVCPCKLSERADNDLDQNSLVFRVKRSWERNDWITLRAIKMASLGLIMKRNMGTGFGNKLALLFLSMILLANSFDVETNPGPANKFHCGESSQMDRQGHLLWQLSTVVSHRLSRNVKSNV